MLYFKLYPFTLLKQSRSFTFLFMYLGELLQYYQSGNNLPQSAETLNLALFCSTLPIALLVVDLPPSHSLLLCFANWLGPWVALLIVDLSPSQSLLLWFGLFGTSSYSAHSWLVSVSIFAALVCSTPRVDLLVVDLSRQSRAETVFFNLSCFVLKPWLALLAVQLSLAAI